MIGGLSMEDPTPASENAPTRLAASSDSLTTDSIKLLENIQTFTTSSREPQSTRSTSETWIRIEPETTTQLSSKKEEAPRAGRGRGRGKKHRGEDKGKTEEEGSGEMTGAEAKGEIQMSRRPAGTSKPRERSREKNRERGHRKGQTTTTPTTTTMTPLESTEVSTDGSGSTNFSTYDASTQTEMTSSTPTDSASPTFSQSTKSHPQSEPSPPFASFSPSPSLSSPTFQPQTQTTLESGHTTSSPHDQSTSTDPVKSLNWVPVKSLVLNSSQEYPPPVLSSPRYEEEPAWSHAVGSGALLPGNMEEESRRGAENISTLSPTGEHCVLDRD